MSKQEPGFNNSLTADELRVLMKVDKYFRSRKMTLLDKLKHAKLIALFDLEFAHFSTEKEKSKVDHFAFILDQLLAKITPEMFSYLEKH